MISASIVAHSNGHNQVREMDGEWKDKIWLRVVGWS